MKSTPIRVMEETTANQPHCGIKGNEHADRLAKQGANIEQEKTLNYTQAEKDNNEEHVQSKEDTR